MLTIEVNKLKKSDACHRFKKIIVLKHLHLIKLLLKTREKAKCLSCNTVVITKDVAEDLQSTEQIEVNTTEGNVG